MTTISKNPQFYSQKWPTKTATKSWRFLLCFWFLLPRFLCLFLLVSPCFLLFHDILEPQKSPPNEVTGIEIHTYAGELFSVPLFSPFKIQEQYHFLEKSFPQQPEANQELETVPPDS